MQIDGNEQKEKKPIISSKKLKDLEVEEWSDVFAVGDHPYIQAQKANFEIEQDATVKLTNRFSLRDMTPIEK